jgi:hypothetical protein
LLAPDRIAVECVFPLIEVPNGVLDLQDRHLIRATLTEDPWSGDLLLLDSIEPWTIRLGELA